MTSGSNVRIARWLKRLSVVTLATLLLSVVALSDTAPVHSQEQEYVLLSNLGFPHSTNQSASVVENYLPTTTAKYGVYFTTGSHPDGYILNSVDIDLFQLNRMDAYVCPTIYDKPVDPLAWKWSAETTNTDGDHVHTNYILSDNCSPLLAPNPIVWGVNNFQLDGELTLAADATYAIVFIRASHQASDPRLIYNWAGGPGDSHSLSPGWSNPNRHVKSRYYVGGWFNRHDNTPLRFQLNGSLVDDLANLPPFFRDTTARRLTVDENVNDGRQIGTVGARDADGDARIYSYSGPDAAAFQQDFVHEAVGGRITVATGRSPDFERKSSYSLTIHVRDGKDTTGAASDAIDDSVAVTIDIKNLQEPGSITFSSSSPEVGEPITVMVHDEDGGVRDVFWNWWTGDRPNSFQSNMNHRVDTYTPTEADLDRYLYVYLLYTDLHGKRTVLTNYVANPVAEAGSSIRSSSSVQSQDETQAPQGTNPETPVIVPVIAPVIAPVIVPVIAPVIAPVIVPVIAPVIVPVIPPVIPPVAIRPVLPPGPALTASVLDTPESHDGDGVFRFELKLSEEPKTGFSYKILRNDGAFTVTGGTVNGVRRLDPPGNIRWEISINPDSTDDVTVKLPATESCAALGAICTSNKRMLSGPVEFSVAGPEPEELTASFESVPETHNGSDKFKFSIAFSGELKTGFSYKTLRDNDAFTVTGGTVSGVRRLDPPGNTRWEISVRPDSNGNVTVVLPVTTDCDARGAICANDDIELSNRLELIVNGPG